VADIDRFLATNHDVIAAWAQSVAGCNRDKAFASVAEHLQSASHTPTKQIAVVLFVFFNDVVLKQIKVRLRQELPGEKTRTAETFKASAGRANRLHCFRP